ncbi:MAG: hydantoinase/oxoprolinase family protein, partial [Candidatus Latescibacterota bacterium]
TVQRIVGNMEPSTLTRVWNTLEDQAREQLKIDGFSPNQMHFRRSANMHYKGQIFELTVPAPDGDLNKNKISELEEAFGQEHERSYGHRAGPEEPVEIVNAQLIGMGVPDRPRIPEKINAERRGPTAALPNRKAYFGPEVGWLDTPVIHRADLDELRSGPCIVEEYDATCLIPPGAKANLDQNGNIIIDL